MRALALVVALAVAFSASSAWAQERRTVTLEEALTLATDGAPAARASVAQVAVARAEVGVAGMLPNPRVSLGTTSATALITGSVVVFLPIFGQVGLARDSARAQVATRAATVLAVQNDARLAAALAWIDLWLAEQESLIARDEASRSARVATIARAREEEGSAPRLDVLRADADAARAVAEADATALAIRAADARFSGAVGVDAERMGWATAGAPFAEADLPPATADASVGERHPLVDVARAVLDESDASSARIARARFPLLALQLGGVFLKRQAPENDVQVALTLDVPLFDGPLLGRAESQRAVAAVALDVTRLDVVARVAAARAEARAAVGRARATADQVLPAAAEAAALAVEAYEHGALDLTAVLAAEQTLAQTRLAAVRAVAERGRAIARLRNALGRR